MPTYDYECEECGQVFELFQSITARAKRKPDEPCAGCGKRAPIRRLIGAGGAVIFKGDGFYETDYRSDSYKKAAKADKDGQSGATDKAGSTGKVESSDSSKKSESGSSKKDTSTDTKSSSSVSGSASGDKSAKGGKSEGTDKPNKKASDS